MWDREKIAADRLQRQGIELGKSGDLTAAIGSWQQALSIYRQISDRQGEG